MWWVGLGAVGEAHEPTAPSGGEDQQPAGPERSLVQGEGQAHIAAEIDLGAGVAGAFYDDQGGVHVFPFGDRECGRGAVLRGLGHRDRAGV